MFGIFRRYQKTTHFLFYFLVMKSQFDDLLKTIVAVKMCNTLKESLEQMCTVFRKCAISELYTMLQLQFPNQLYFNYLKHFRIDELKLA